MKFACSWHGEWALRVLQAETRLTVYRLLRVFREGRIFRLYESLFSAKEDYLHCTSHYSSRGRILSLYESLLLKQGNPRSASHYSSRRKNVPTPQVITLQAGRSLLHESLLFVLCPAISNSSTCHSRRFTWRWTIALRVTLRVTRRAYSCSSQE